MPENTQIADRLEITELFARLSRVLDENRHEDVRTVYTEDVMVRSPRGQFHGIDEVIAFLRQSQVDGEHTEHAHSEVLVDLDGDQAHASAYQSVTYYRPGEPPHGRTGVRLAYTAVRTPAGWRFREAQLTRAWTQEN